ncbi:MAG TPA: DNA translocase FtsK 4TM domain-containing protein [Candidatus Saccharimonadales bacterium]|jgi:S-DNA-T family DNA segregation ATPase FtsK/SpoIIIE|nr:DNA translocase FtsK 4TM domain-containing protein [Candidatus Saccharimonadales bacterium]
MAKKKKTTRKKKVEEVKERSPFWGQATAIILMLAAILLLIGGFGTGGPLPVNLFKGVYATFGWAAYFSPVALVALAVFMFQAEDHKLSKGKLFGMLAVIIFASAGLQVMFTSKTASGWADGHGGAVGRVVGNTLLGALDKIPASLVFFVLTLLAVFFAFGISLAHLLRVGNLFKREASEEENDLAALKAKATEQQAGFQLNEGVPVVHHSPGEPRLSTLKNTAQKMTANENHEALTTASDPNWQFPSIDLLNQKQDKADAGDVNSNAQIIHDTFENFNIGVEMEGANIGPRVTQYTLKPPTGVKLTKITALENNLALDLAATSIRMEAPIPGKRAVGIEVPNVKSATVRVSSIFLSQQWQEMQGALSIGIGKDISGIPLVADLDKMPHLLVAGQTGSGKSVMINTILTSLLYRNSPADLKLILVDPKRVELKPYDDIPHLLTPVITEPEKCISALKWAVAEMERRYHALSEVGKRNIGEYNSLKKEEGMPYIVIVIDELADLMMMAARDVEALIVRIAQKARAVGIHLVLATQRPSVDVITGLIKANVPARIAFTTASQVDSRTIIDQVGAEKLLGQGDMLFLTADMPKPKRIQGALIGEEETSKVTDFIRMQRPPQYDDEVVSQPVVLNGKGGVVADHGGNDMDDEMWRDAVHVVIENRKASTSLLQRRLRIGYGRAARLIETMEEQGIVGAADGSRPREVLVHSMDEVFGGGEATPAGTPDAVLDENFAD